MSSYDLWITVLVVCYNIFIGYRVWRANPKQLSNRLFFLIVVEFCLWVVCNYFSKAVVEPVNFLLFVRLVMVVTAPLPVTLYLFSLAFPNHRSHLSSRRKLLLILWVGFITLLNFTPFVFKGATVVNGAFSPQANWGILFVLLNFGIFLPLAGINFVKKIIHAHGLERTRLTYLSVAFIAMIAVGLGCNFILPAFFQNSSFLNLGSWLMSTIITGLIGYSLLKIRFSSLDFFLVKIFYYFVLLILITGLIMAVKPLAILANDNLWLIVPFILVWTMIFVLVYQDLQTFLIRKVVNHGCDWEEENKNFLQAVSKATDINIIITDTLNFFTTLIHNEGNLIVGDFFDDGNLINQGDFVFKSDQRVFYDLYHQQWRDATDKNEPLIADEIDLEKQAPLRSLVQSMKKNHIAAIFPIAFYDQQLSGILIMGQKTNLNPYFIQDIAMIKQTLIEVSLLLNKAVMLQNSQNFNEYLQKKIDRATAKLVKVNQQLVFADKMKDEFVSIASHELRTPMTAIKNYLFLVKKNNNVRHLRQNANYIEIALRSTERLINMVNDMLTISRIEGDRFELNLQQCDLSEIVTQSYNTLKPLAATKKIKFVIEKNTVGTLVVVDHDKISEVIANLIGNAIKFTVKGGVFLSCEQKNNEVCFTVRDTGSGIDTADFPKIFNKFCRLENSYTKIKETGTGLGLYIAQQIMQKHHGKITFTSELGVGSTFVLHFPKATK